MAFFRFVRDENELHGVLDHLLFSHTGLARGGPLGAATEELHEDILLDRAGGAVGEEPGVLAAAIMGASVMTARHFLARGGDFDPAEAAAFCTRFVLHGGLTQASTSQADKSRTGRRAPLRAAGGNA